MVGSGYVVFDKVFFIDVSKVFVDVGEILIIGLVSVKIEFVSYICVYVFEIVRWIVVVELVDYLFDVEIVVYVKWYFKLLLLCV